MTAFRQVFGELPRKPQGVIVVIAAFLPIIAIVAMGPAVPAMIAHFADVASARGDVPAMIGAPGLAVALIAPFAGWLVDRLGRRRLLLIATLFYALFGAAPLFLDSLNQIYISRLLLGVSEAFILTTVNTLIGDYWSGNARNNWLFLQGLLGPFIAGFIALIVGFASNLQWNGVFYIYLVAIPIWAAMLIWLFEPARRAPDKTTATEPATAFPWASAALVSAVTFLFSMLYYVFIINGSLAFAEIGVTRSDQYGELIFIPQLFVLAGAALFRLLADRGAALQLAVVLVLLGSGLAGMGLAHSVTAMVIALTVQQTAAGMTVPTLISWVQGKFGFAHRGRGLGLWTAAFFLAQSQSPRLVHVIDARAGSMQGAFLVMGIIALCAAACGFGLSLRASAKAVPA